MRSVLSLGRLQERKQELEPVSLMVKERMVSAVERRREISDKIAMHNKKKESSLQRLKKKVKQLMLAVK